MKELSAKQKKRLQKILDLIEQGDLAIAEYLFELEDKIDTEIPEIANIISRLKGDKGDTPTKEQLLELIEPLIPEPLPPEKYILTEEDTREIANRTVKLVPTIEKIVEKTEVIKEIPIVTQQITNEIKEVAMADTGEQIVDKINTLPTDDEDLKIDEEHINFKKLLKRIVALESRPSGGINGGIVGRDIIRDIDISDQLDGVTKTFNIQAVWHVISVDLDSYPYGSLRKTADYTWTPTSITFTSAIDAATQLAAGQKCIITAVLA